MQGTAIATITCLGTVLAVLLTLPQASGRNFIRRGEPLTLTYKRNFTMPGVTPRGSDAYLCTAVALNQNVEEWVIKFNPLASANRAHHMLLFGCSEVNQDSMKDGYWDCGHHGVCGGGRIMYAWAKNAPATELPDGVGFRIGGQSGIQYLTLQIHYADPLPVGVYDHSGLQMELTQQQQKYKAGIYLLAAGRVDIPPNTEKTHADMNCIIGRSGEPKDIYLFAYRVHAHVLGTVISGYLFDPETKEYTEIAKGNPHWPQAFYPMSQIYHVRTNNILHARCTWNSTSRARHTYIGSTSADEMCNLYLMYYTDRDEGSESGGCGAESFPFVTYNLPADNDVPLPPNPVLEEHAHGENKHEEKAYSYSSVDWDSIKLEKKAHSHKDPQSGYGYENFDSDYSTQQQMEQQPWGGWNYLHTGDENMENPPEIEEYVQPPNLFKDVQPPPTLNIRRKGKQLRPSAYHVVPDWGQKEVKYGQIVAVALDSHDNVVIFHRGERSWDGSTFVNNRLRNKKNVVTQPALLHLDKDSGDILHKWGENYFFMPHGLTLDKDDNIWVTDVGLQQVLKFPAGYGQGQPLLALGTRFETGNDDTHFCQPTGVAVLNSGEFFVSDGYCNARVIKYSADGKILFQFGKEYESILKRVGLGTAPLESFRIPHALTLAEDKGEVCVADRENGRVQCFTIAQGKYTRQFQYDTWGSRIFSVSYTPAYGGKLFAINGPQFLMRPKISAFEVGFTSGELQSAFSPYDQGLSNPHDIVASRDGRTIYIVEIGPHKVWKFELESAKETINKTLNASQLPKIEIKSTHHIEETAKQLKGVSSFSTKWSSVGVSTVVLGLLAVPIIVLTTLTLIIRARRSGRFGVRNLQNGSLSASIRGLSSRHENGLNLGSLLNKHRGFEKVATEDLDLDAPDSGDSDIEEFSQVATRA